MQKNLPSLLTFFSKFNNYCNKMFTYPTRSNTKLYFLLPHKSTNKFYNIMHIKKTFNLNFIMWKSTNKKSWLNFTRFRRPVFD